MNRWFVDETYVKVNGVWRYAYRAVDQHGQVIDVPVSARRDGEATRWFFRRALTALKVTPTEVVTDAAPVYPRVLDDLVSAAWHHVEQYANNRIEADHSRLKVPGRQVAVVFAHITTIKITPAANASGAPGIDLGRRGSGRRVGPRSPDSGHRG